MATHDYNLANQSGASFRSDLNDALQAILTNNSSASSPSTTAAYMFWADTNTGILKIRNSSNDAWVELLQLDGTLTLEDGSASACALGFRDELNTGIFSSGSSNFDVSIAGTTRLNISATGLNVTGTVTDDGATHDGDVTFTGASANIVFDKSDNALEFADNAKAVFGAGSDLQISHDGNNSIINDNGTGELQLQRAGNTILALGSGGITVTDPDGDASVAIKGFEGQSAKVELVADEGDDNGDTWTLKSVASDNDLAIQNDTSGSNVTLWSIGTDGAVRQTAKLEIIAGASSMIHLGESSGDFSYRLRANVSSSTNGGFLIEDGNGSADLYKVVSGSSGSHTFSINGSSKMTLNSSGILTTTGQIRAGGGSESAPALSFAGNTDAGFHSFSDNAIKCIIDGDNKFIFGLTNFTPNDDDVSDLGSASLRWDQVRATHSTIVTSDRNEKNTIVASDLGLDFVNKLTPVSYKFNNKTRTHYGLIAQDIETVLGTISKSATDFGGFCKDTITEDPDGNALDTPLVRYGLRYTEFLAPMIKAIQELSAKVTALEGA